jgi:LemA protein
LVVAVLMLAYIYLQNRLASAKNAVTTGYSSIDVQLKRRHDLVPLLVDSVRSAMAHEDAIFDKILDARKQALSARNNDIETVEAAEANLTRALRQLVAHSEDTPELTATNNIAELQKQLEETEDQISAARRLYNGNVERFNTMLDSIPTNYIARAMGLQRAKPFSLSDAEAKVVGQMPSINLPGAQT